MAFTYEEMVRAMPRGEWLKSGEVGALVHREGRVVSPLLGAAYARGLVLRRTVGVAHFWRKAEPHEIRHPSPPEPRATIPQLGGYTRPAAVPNPAPLLAVNPAHGTVRMFLVGCKCEACLSAWRVYQAAGGTNAGGSL